MVSVRKAANLIVSLSVPIIATFIGYKSQLDNVCSSDSLGDSLDLQQHYVISASKNVENNYVERCRDQKAAENDDISDKNQTLTPSSSMVVEEGALLS